VRAINTVTALGLIGIFKEEKFCFWLKGFIELNNNTPTSKQWGYIKNKLKITMKEPEEMRFVFPEPRKKKEFTFKPKWIK